MSSVAIIEWSPSIYWEFIRRDDHDVLECWKSEGSIDPRRLYAWSLVDLDNYKQVLLVLLQRYHRALGATLSDVMFAIIAVQNAFARSLTPKAQLGIYDTEDAP